MFKPTPALQGTLRRLPLSTKQAGKEYYKGNRVGSMGTITRYGNFTPDWNKIRTYVYPVLGTKSAEVCMSAANPTPLLHPYTSSLLPTTLPLHLLRARNGPERALGPC